MRGRMNAAVTIGALVVSCWLGESQGSGVAEKSLQTTYLRSRQRRDLAAQNWRRLHFHHKENQGDFSATSEILGIVGQPYCTGKSPGQITHAMCMAQNNNDASKWIVPEKLLREYPQPIKANNKFCGSYAETKCIYYPAGTLNPGEEIRCDGNIAACQERLTELWGRLYPTSNFPIPTWIGGSGVTWSHIAQVCKYMNDGYDRILRWVPPTNTGAAKGACNAPNVWIEANVS